MSDVSPKVAASTTTGAAALVIVWLLGLFGIEVPTEVAVAITVCLSTAAGYLTRDRLRDLGEARRYEPKHDAD